MADISSDVGYGHSGIRVAALADPLGLQAAKETLRSAVVPTVAVAAHALADAEPLKAFAVPINDILAALIGVHQYTGRRSLQLKSQPKGASHELGVR